MADNETVIDGELTDVSYLIDRSEGISTKIDEGDDLRQSVFDTIGTYFNEKTRRNPYRVGRMPQLDPLTGVPLVADDGTPLMTDSPLVVAGDPFYQPPDGTTPPITLGGNTVDGKKFFTQATRGTFPPESTAQSDAVAAWDDAGALSMALNSEDVGSFITFLQGIKQGDGSGNTLLSDIRSFDPGKASGKKRSRFSRPELGVGSDSSTPGPDDPLGKVQRTISQVLTTNRFHPANVAEPTAGQEQGPGNSPFIDEDEISYLYTIQQKLGVYQGVSNDSGQEVKEVTLGDLRNIALGLMLRATGEPNFTDLDNPLTIDQDDTLLPTTVQLQMEKVSAATLTAASMGEETGYWGDAGTKFDIPDSGGTGTSEAGDGTGDVGGQGSQHNALGLRRSLSRSYGSLNSHLEPFSGAMPMGMIMVNVTALVGVIVLSFLIEGIVTLCNLSSVGGDSMAPTGALPKGAGSGADPTELQKGRYIPVEGWAQMLLEMFKIPNTFNRWDKCFNRGIQLFYGFPPIQDFSMDDLTPDFIMEQATNILQASGFYVGIMRAVVRDIEQVTLSAEKMADSASFTGGLSSFVEFIDAITSSTTWRWIMAMVGIGDTYLKSMERQMQPIKVNVDAIPSTAANRIMKNREMDPYDAPGGGFTGPPNKGPGDRRLAWRHGSTPSAYVLPARLLAAGKNMDLRNSFAMSLSGKGDIGNPNNIVESSGGRISVDDVMKIENQLEAEYMPFYFHDLRTNEIISFHAFLSDLNEAFSPSWQSMQMMGRVDNVKIYQSTTRTLTMSFMAVATGKRDFDMMWYDLNKLATMVYPQYTPGKKYEGNQMEGAEKVRFRMPFSQVMSASPVIRLRIGDLIKSNYSKFNLARLFGVDDPDYYTSQAGGDPVERAEALNKYQVGLQALQEAYNRRTIMCDVSSHHEDGTPNTNVISDATFLKLQQAGLDPDDLALGGETKAGYKKGDCVICDFPQFTKQLQVAPPPPAEGDYAAEASALADALSGHTELVRVPTGVKAVVIADPEENASAEGSRVIQDLLLMLSVDQEPGLAADAGGGKDFIWKDTSLYYLPDLVGQSYTANSTLDRPDSLDQLALRASGLPAEPAAEESPPDTETQQGAEPQSGAETGQSADAEPEGLPLPAQFFNDGIGGNSETDKINFVVRSFREAGGRGLACVITSMNFNYTESTYELSIGSKAPMFVKINMAFEILHDISPGLDHSGMMRAPIWPVGPMLHGFGEVHSDTGRMGDARAIEMKGLGKIMGLDREDESGTTPEVPASL